MTPHDVDLLQAVADGQVIWYQASLSRTLGKATRDRGAGTNPRYAVVTARAVKLENGGYIVKGEILSGRIQVGHRYTLTEAGRSALDLAAERTPS